MSSPIQSPQIFSLKSPLSPPHRDDSEDTLPSAFDLAFNGKPSTKPTDSNRLDPDAFRRLSTSTLSALSAEGRISRSNSISMDPHPGYAPRSTAPRTWRSSIGEFWQRNRGMILVSSSQLFGALMNVTTRLLELEGEGMAPFQVLFVRMGLTMLLCIGYMWWTKVPYFPFGMKEVRPLLVMRGLSGFFGIYGMYYSLLYLPIAEATVITFLAPGVAAFACYILIREPFTRIEQISTVISLLGVLLIARPTSFFHLSSTSSSSVPTIDSNSTLLSSTNTTSIPTSGEGFAIPTSAQRLSAIGVSLLGVLGSAGAYTSMRWIGKRAHPLISVNYFAVWCTFVSFSVLTLSPIIWPGSKLSFQLPANLRQWAMLFFLGACGFIMQFMLAAGLAHEKSNRATNMVYTQMLFALLFDKMIFGTTPGGWSLVGSVLILGSALFVAIGKGREQEVVRVAAATGGDVEEEGGLLSDMDGNEEEVEEVQLQTLRL